MAVWPSQEEAALRKELEFFGATEFMSFNVLYEAENIISHLGSIKGFCPKVRYWMYVTQELLIEGEPEDWSSDDLFNLVRQGKTEEKCKAARRVLADWKAKASGDMYDSKWRGRVEGDEETFG